MARHEIPGDNTTNSEVMISSDSLSLMISSDSLSFPSEPPDIGNWFSSYVYQSPELNSIDDFKDCRKFRGNDSGIKDREKENGELLLVDGRIASNGFVQSVNSCGDDESPSEDLGSSDCLSFSPVSEPPDIKNWYSSYEYESPALDSSDAFLISDHNDRNSTVTKHGAISDSEEKEEDFSDFPGAVRCDLVNQDVTSARIVKCIREIKDTKSDNQQVHKHSHESDNNRSLTGNLKRRESDDNGSTNDARLNKESVNGDLNGKLDGSVNGGLNGKLDGEGSHRLVKINKDSDENGRKLPSNSFRAKNSAELISNVLPSGSNATGGSNEKENYGNGFPENGFISTRKNKGMLTRDENHSRKTLGIRSCSSRSGVTDSLSAKSNTLVRTTILAETTNYFQQPNVLEITSKWKCPQKNKPNLGPPLKQLRLEQWVRRA